MQIQAERFVIDEEKIKTEACFDGKWVLRTNTSLASAQVAVKYKQLWTMENIFRSAKTLLETRSIFHKTDETIRGHVFCSFLALVLRKALQDRLEAMGEHLKWADVIRDLEALSNVVLVLLTGVMKNIPTYADRDNIVSHFAKKYSFLLVELALFWISISSK